MEAEASNFQHFFELVIVAVFINNILLHRFLGTCPFMGVSKKMDTAIGMALAVVFVLTLAAFITYGVRQILVETHIEYIQTLAFILVIASLVQFVEMFLKKAIPALYKSLGIFLPLITTNCAVLGACIYNIDEKLNLVDAMVMAFASAVGFGLALVLFAGIREKFETARIPAPMQGTGIALVTAGIIALSFYAFKGMI